MKTNAFTGTGTLVRLALRCDRVKLSIWILVIALMTLAMTASYANMLETEAELADMINMWADNPAFRAIGGPASGLSVGAFTMIRASAFIVVLIAIMSIQAVVRHTRQNEESGRAEMIGSTIVGRHASLAAAIIVTVGANIVLSVLIGLAFIANGLPASGSFAAGMAMGGLGIAFTGLAAIFAQVSETVRGAGGMTYISMAALFLVNSIGNLFGEVLPSGVETTSTWPVWLSPFGWYQQMHAFHQNNWWVLILPLLFLAVTVPIAFCMTNRRDVGLGLVPARKGKADAAPGLLSPLGLAWRLQRGSFIAWGIAFFVIGVMLGSARDQLGEVIADNQSAVDIFGGSVHLADYFLATLISLVATLVVIYTLQALLRMNTEEASGHAEPILATAVERPRWMLSHIIVAVLGTLGILLLWAMGAALGAGGEFALLVKAALIQAPAILVIAGLAAFAFGLLPRWASGLAWAIMAISLATSPMFAEVFGLPDWLMNISSFNYIPAMYEEITAAPLILLTVIGLLLVGVGLAAFQHRSLNMRA